MDSGIAGVSFCWDEPRSRRTRNPNKSRKIYILKSKYDCRLVVILGRAREKKKLIHDSLRHRYRIFAASKTIV